MNLQEAVQLLDNVCASVQLNREGHIKVQQAIAIIRQAVEPKKEEKSEDEDQ